MFFFSDFFPTENVSFVQCSGHVVNFTGDLNRDTSYWGQDGEAGGQACAEDKNQIDCKLALSSVWVPGF